MMDFVLKMMDFVLKIMIFAFKLTISYWTADYSGVARPALAASVWRLRYRREGEK